MHRIVSSFVCLSASLFLCLFAFCFLFVCPSGRSYVCRVMSLIVIVVIVVVIDVVIVGHCRNWCCQFLSLRLVLSLLVLLVLAVVLVLAPPVSIWKVDMEAAKMPTETVVLLEAVGILVQYCLFLILL